MEDKKFYDNIESMKRLQFKGKLIADTLVLFEELASKKEVVPKKLRKKSERTILQDFVKGLKQSQEIEIVGIAKNGQEELDYIKQFCPDVVITDIEMPKMTGVEVIEIAKDFENPPEFIVITGGASSEIMKKLYLQLFLELTNE